MPNWIFPSTTVAIEIMCMGCGGVMEFCEVPTCASAHRGPHPHVRCAKCVNRLGPKTMCVMMALHSEGDA